VNAVITAGGRVDGEYAAEAGTDVKALAVVRGATMLARIIEGVRAAGATRIAVIGGDEVRRACEGDVERVIPERPRGSENVIAALRAWSDHDEPLLYATSDMPYASAAAVCDFARRAPDGHVSISLCDYAVFDSRFPQAPPGFGIRLAGERVVNGGLFVIPAGAAERIAGIAAQFFDARKAPWKMVRLVNPGAALRFAFGRLSIAHLETEARRIAGVPATAVRNCAPELGYDADSVAEYRYARANA
jgi:GTP:adenosylcobinamide-phosphate guanylyltransferase